MEEGMEERVKKLNSLCIITQDMQKMRKFYQEILQIQPVGDDAFLNFAVSGAAVSLFPAQGMEVMAPGAMNGAGYGGCVLEFEVADVDAEYARLLALAAPIVKPPTTQPWGIRSVWFRDPEGNLINFFAPVK